MAGRRFVGGYGPERAELVIVGEAPGRKECLVGRPFIGPSGQLLNATLEAYGIDRDSCYATNSVMCDVKPRNAELDACWPRLRDEIMSRKPKLVLTLGAVAFQQVCRTNGALRNTQGTLWWQEELGVWVLPTWHPAAILRGGASDKLFPDLMGSIGRVAKYLDGTLEFPDPNASLAFPWTFFRGVPGALKALSYYERKASKGRLQLAFDTESISTGKHGPRPEDDTWIMSQFYDGERAAAIAMIDTYNFDEAISIRDPELDAAFIRLFRHPNITWNMHNGAQYDCRVLRVNLGECPPDHRMRDTMMLGLGLTELNTRIGLEPLSRTWLNSPAYKKDLANSGYKYSVGPRSEAQWRHLARYGVEDVYNGWNLNRVLPPVVKKEGTMKLVKDLLMPLAMTCGRLSQRGILVDQAQVKRLDELWGGARDRITYELQELAIEAGWPLDEKYVKAKDGRLNPGSHLQLAHLMYDVLGMQPTDGTTNRKYTSKWDGGRSERSVDSDFLIGHLDDEGLPGEACQQMQKLRIFAKLVSTYVKGIANDVYASDGLAHPDAKIAGTATGRLVWNHPPVQVLPHYGAHAQLFEEDFSTETRRLFPARPGYVVVSADFKQLELRMAWALSGDEELGKTLMTSDPHARTAAGMFRKPEENVNDADRHAAKRVSFGVLYGRTAFTLARGPLLEITGGNQDLAQAYIDRFFTQYSVYHEYWKRCRWEAINVGELVTPFGRKRRWPLITDDNKKEVMNQGCNFPIQSTASDMCSLALIRLEAELERREIGWPLYTVHDEIVSEIREDRLDEGIAVIKETMTRAPFPTSAQFLVDVKVGPTLGDLVKIK